jgi:hypothetical protein
MSVKTFQELSKLLEEIEWNYIVKMKIINYIKVIC